MLVAQTSLQRINDLFSYQSNPDALGVDGREDFPFVSLLDLLKLRFPDSLLHGFGQENEMSSLCVRNSLQVAEVESDENSGTKEHHRPDSFRVLEPLSGSTWLKVTNLVTVDVVASLGLTQKRIVVSDPVRAPERCP